MITVEVYPEVGGEVLPDEVYEAMTTGLHTRIQREFPWQNLSHSIELDERRGILLTLWSERKDSSDPLNDLDETQMNWLNAQAGFVWGIEDKENRENLSLYRINSQRGASGIGRVTIPL